MPRSPGKSGRWVRHSLRELAARLGTFYTPPSPQAAVLLSLRLSPSALFSPPPSSPSPLSPSPSPRPQNPPRARWSSRFPPSAGAVIASRSCGPLLFLPRATPPAIRRGSAFASEPVLCARASSLFHRTRTSAAASSSLRLVSSPRAPHQDTTLLCSSLWHRCRQAF